MNKFMLSTAVAAVAIAACDGLRRRARPDPDRGLFDGSSLREDRSRTVRRNLHQLQDAGRRIRAAAAPASRNSARASAKTPSTSPIPRARSRRTNSSPASTPASRRSRKSRSAMTASSLPPTSPVRIGRWSPRTSTTRWPPSSSSTASWSTIRTPSGARSIRSCPTGTSPPTSRAKSTAPAKFSSRSCMDAGCDKDAIKAAGVADDKEVGKTCIAIRKDGKAVDIDGDYTETLARIDSNKTGVGVFGLAFYENNADKLKVATVKGVVALRRDDRQRRVSGVASAVLLREEGASRRRAGPQGICRVLPVRPDDRPRQPARRVRPGCRSGCRAPGTARRVHRRERPCSRLLNQRVRAATPAPGRLYQLVPAWVAGLFRRMIRPKSATFAVTHQGDADVAQSGLCAGRCDRRRRILLREATRGQPGQWCGQGAFATALSRLVGLPARHPAGRTPDHRLGDRLVGLCRPPHRCAGPGPGGRCRRRPRPFAQPDQGARQRPAQARRRDARQAAADLRRIAAAARSQGRRAGHRHQGLHDPGRRRGEQAAGPARR